MELSERVGVKLFGELTLSKMNELAPPYAMVRKLILQVCKGYQIFFLFLLTAFLLMR